MDVPFRIIPKCGRDNCARILGIGEEDDNYPKSWQYGLWSFQTGDKKLERLLNSEFWINGELLKNAKI